MKILDIKKKSDIDKIESYVGSDYFNRDLSLRLKSIYTSNLKCILIEYPFVDMDYRSTYYNFYSKKGLRHLSYCFRLHFFNKAIYERDCLLYPKNLSDYYLGFSVLRPINAPLGRTIFSPNLIKNFDGFIMTAEYKSHILGYEFTIKGFPFKSQHTDVAVCAHVACWAILRYFSQKFSLYSEKLTYDITKMASPIAPGGLIPSNGFSVEQATRIFSLADFYPHIYDIKAFPNEEKNFYRILYSYIESGFPLFAAMPKQEHAITVIGHGPIKSPSNSEYLNEKGNSFFPCTWDFIKTLIVNDDNEMPYKAISETNPSAYGINDIKAFIVPLPEKVYYPAEAVLKQMDEFWQSNLLDLSFIKKPIIRFFITTSSAYKCFLKDNRAQIPNEIFIPSVETSMPKFIWIVEITSLQLIKTKKAMVRFIFDATANMYERLPFFLIHDRKKVLIFDRGLTKEIYERKIKNKIGNFQIFNGNLTEFN